MMAEFTFKRILLFLVDLPEKIILILLNLLKLLLSPKNRKQSKIQSLSHNATVIESGHKGLKVISIEVLDNFSVYHAIHKKEIKAESLEKMQSSLARKLLNPNIFISHENGDTRLLKVVIQNLA